MAIYKYLFNPLSGEFDLANDESSFHLKDSVASQANLPLTGNSENDMRFVSDTDDAYVWSIASTTGLLTDWKKMPILANLKLDDVADGTTYGRVKIADLLNGQLKQIRAQVAGADVTGDNIKDAVDKKHTQGTDQGLDTGGSNAVTASQAKTGYTHSQVAHAPSDAVSLSTVKADTDIDNAIDNIHTQGTDQGLDTGGSNAVTATQAKAGYTHSQATHAPTDAVSLATVKADTDIDNAIDNIHTQGTDQGLDTGGSNAVTASQAKTAYTHSGVTSGNPHNVTKTDVGLSNVSNIANNTGTIVFIIDGNGGVISTGEKGWVKVPFACTLTGWTLTGTPSGSIKIDIWKDTYANFPPTDADSITNAHEPQLVGAVKAIDTDISDWSDVTVDIDDYLKFNIDSCSDTKYIELVINYTRT